MSSRFVRSSAMLALFVVGAVSLPSVLRAQEGAIADQATPVAVSTAAGSSSVLPVAPAAASDVVPAAGPRVSRAGIDKPTATNPLGAPEPQEGAHVGAGTNLALIGVGVAGVVVGLVIGGNGGAVVAAGSAVVGLIGLYRWLK